MSNNNRNNFDTNIYEVMRRREQRKAVEDAYRSVEKRAQHKQQ